VQAQSFQFRGDAEVIVTLEATFKELQKQIPTKILRIWDANDEDRNVTVRKIELVQVKKIVKSMNSTYSLTSHC
jgi:hypothetical protein